MASSHRSLSSSLETLETRIAPAAFTATFSGGVLKITALSPTTAVDVFLTQVDADSLSVGDAFSIVGTFDGVKSIQATLSDADDNIFFNMNPATPFRGSIVVNTLGNDAGIDNVGFNSATIIGPVTVNSVEKSLTHVSNLTSLRGPLKVTSPGGGLLLDGSVETVVTNQLFFVDLTETAKIKGALTVNANFPTTPFATQLLSFAGSLVGGPLTFNGAGLVSGTFTLGGQILGKALFKFGNGSNTLTTTSDFRAAGGLTVKGGTFNDSLTFNGPNSLDTAIAGSVVLNLGDGNNAVTVTGGRIAGLLRVTAGAGQDTVTVGQALIGGALQTSLGAAGSDPNQNLVSVSGFSTICGGLQITGGPDNDRVNILQSTVLGATRVNLAAGNNVFSGVGANFDSGFSYLGLEGGDSVNFGGVFVRGPLSISVGDGTSHVGLNAAMVHGNTIFKGGNIGNEDFQVDANTAFNGTLTINAGEGSNAAILNSLSNITAFTYNGGAGSDFVAISNTSPVPDAGFYTRGRVKLGGGNDHADVSTGSFLTLTVDGGLGGDTITQSAAAVSAGLVIMNFETIITN